ncbi:hypothetical protein [Pseudonocardia kunmingensis]|nr:hypothetical protein [Pseudonocardia kunmingensis]
MTTPQRLGALLLLVGIVAAGCSSEPIDAPQPAPTGPEPPSRTTSEQLAMAAYEEFWTVTDMALAAPALRDWTPRIEEVATGQARQALQADVVNYASVPAHTEGAVTRAPVVGRVTDERIQVVDCVDLGASRLISDTTGEVLDDLTNRVQRYRFRAELVEVDGRWVVERTAPALGEPC